MRSRISIATNPRSRRAFVTVRGWRASASRHAPPEHCDPRHYFPRSAGTRTESVIYFDNAACRDASAFLLESLDGRDPLTLRNPANDCRRERDVPLNVYCAGAALPPLAQPFLVPQLDALLAQWHPQRCAGSPRSSAAPVDESRHRTRFRRLLGRITGSASAPVLPPTGDEPCAF